MPNLFCNFIFLFTYAVNHHSNCTLITISSAAASLSTLIIVSLILAFYRLRRSRRRIFDSNSAPNSNLEVGNHQQLWSFPSDLGPISLQKYSYHEILEATQSFADVNIIGYGGSGFVYRGVLKEGRVVAIKRHAHQHFERMDQFYNEIRILSMVDHPNLVKLYGFCYRDDKDLLLVFEHVCNGSLYDQLHHQKDAEKKNFSCRVVGINSWRVRLRLSMEIAQALSFLHNCASPQILHRDVKTSNILLDDGFHAKLADFGLSRLVPLRARHVSTDPQGTPGYVDPEYLNCYRLTDKSDVYSFGVVLMELVSGMLPVDVSRSEKDTILSSMALLKEKEGTWKELVDSNCWREDEDINAGIASLEMMQLAFWCLRPNKEDRPSMGEVAGTLTKLWWSYGGES
ncbi:hypothetical protein KP509_18G056300 [Ceratopteris richardii]|uniref:Protein kinase domain-containing protein n=1 Tax=Ceratopteris richardii TaxID=49495 RepID=A0A8T2ST27_CERRI|nr:hypothetical protein KP509_18G056300 [Ceratopteris richardii]